MERNIVISRHVVNTIKSLPHLEREAISDALARELILGQDPNESLTPVQSMIYAMIRFYVRQDMDRSSSCKTT